MKKYWLLIFLAVSSTSWLYGQGCSDAGFCTLNTIKDHGLDLADPDIHRHQLTTGISYGAAQNDVSVVVPYLEYVFHAKDFLDIGAKLTYQSSNGELGQVSGFGDLFISSNYRLYKGYSVNHSFTLGFKIPLSDANLMSNGASLPMVYQVSLGTFDVIAGYNLTFKRFGFGFAYQQPLSNPNGNQFIPASFPDPRAGDYLPTRDFSRSADVLLRATYAQPLLKDKLKARVGLLPIYHLSEDTFIDENDMEQSIAGSQGLTLNFNLAVDFSFSDVSQVSINYGRPWIARDAIPDGLLRTTVLGFEYKVRF